MNIGQLKETQKSILIEKDLYEHQIPRVVNELKQLNTTFDETSYDRSMRSSIRIWLDTQKAEKGIAVAKQTSPE